MIERDPLRINCQLLSRGFLSISLPPGWENNGVRDGQWAEVQQQGHRLATLWFESWEELASLIVIRSYAKRRNVGGFCFRSAVFVTWVTHRASSPIRS